MDTIEPAASARAKCRACGHPIDKGMLRFGERVPNPYGEGEATYWFHVPCAAERRPERFVAHLEREPSVPGAPSDWQALLAVAREGVAHHRLPRIAGLERAKSGRARCRQCRQSIAQDGWRIVLSIWEEGRFAPMGFVHLGCSGDYFETRSIAARLERVAPSLAPADWRAIRSALGPGA